MKFTNKMETNQCVKLVFLTIFLNPGVLTQYTGLVREYCMETFNPRCQSDEVIHIKHAMYGRMKTGSCVKSEPSIQECSADELIFFDKLCSGKHSCELTVPNPGLTAKQPCLKGLLSYLEASYICQKVYKSNKEKCVAPEKLTAKKKTKFIASIISKETNCGIHESPWIIEAQPGQNINLSLIDFSWQNKIAEKCPVKFGYILDQKSDDVINICGGGKRNIHLYLSRGHSVQIVLEASVVQNQNFLIQYQATGCPIYTPPKYSWSQPENNSLVIQCEHSEGRWKLRCVDNIWLGIVGNCTPPPVKKEGILPAAKVKIASVKSADTSAGLISISDNHVVAFALGCVTLIICFAVIFLGIYFTKRYEVKTLEQISMQQSQKMRFPDGTIRTVKSSTIYKPIRERAPLPQGTIELPPYAFPLPPDQRAPKVPNRQSSCQDPMVTSMQSDYLTPQNGDIGDDTNSVMYYILENPGDPMGNMSEEMYQSIHLHNSLNSNKT